MMLSQTKISLPIKIALISLILTLMGVSFVSMVSYTFSDRILQKKALQSLAQKVDRESIVIAQRIQMIHEDLKTFIDFSEVQGFARALNNDGFDEESNMTLEMWKERMSILFQTVLTQRNMYDQIRLIGIEEGGREIIRVERMGKSIQRISEADLQKKEHRNYFQKGLQLSPGDVYFSDVSLNRERGKITYPLRPMLRALTPLYDSNGNLFALLVINSELKKIASGLKKAPDNMFYFLSNDQGDYLIHPNKKKAMAFEDQREARVQRDYDLGKKQRRMDPLKGGDLIKTAQSGIFNLPQQGIGLSLYHVHFDSSNLERFLIVGGVEKLSSLKQESLTLRNQLLIIVFILSFILALITFIVVRGITKPILQLKEAADRVSAGEESVLIPVQGKDEIASLGQSFQEMLGHLSKSRRQLRESNVLLEQRNVELGEALEQAQTATQLKSQFLATMSHEIRTPLNGVLGLTELVLDSTLTLEQRENLKAVLNSGQTLLNLLNDILDFSKMEAGQFELSSTNFSLNALIEQITKLYSQEAHRKGIELLGITLMTLTHELVGDPDRLRQILMNLISNAIKFTHSGEVLIQIEALSENSHSMKIRFSVCDTGIGISPENQKKLFQEFSQVDASHTRKYGGTGLGLVIVRRLIHLMGGEIFVESQEDKGSRFWFEIDLGKAGKLPPKSLRYKISLDQWRVLIVDDNATNLQLLQQRALSWGMRSEVIDNGNAALQLLLDAVNSEEEESYDLALIDHMMPEMDGLELAQHIKENPQLNSLKVLLLSSLEDVFDLQEKHKYGLHGFLRKPVFQSELFNLILSVMSEKESLTASEVLEESSLKKRWEQILLVEDVIINQKVVLGMLQSLGFTEVDVANNGVEALTCFESRKYALILMDIRMPLMDGHLATQKIRFLEQEQEQNEEKRTPILALTAHAFAEDRIKCLESGMDELLTKPVSKAKLKKMLDYFLSEPHNLKEVTKNEAETKTSQKIKFFRGLLILDEEVLRKLHFEIQAGFSEILDIYREQLPEDIESICIALKEGNLEDVSSNAHRLKGSSCHMGTQALAELCDTLESQVKDGEVTEVDVMIQALKEQENLVLHSLKEAWIEELL